MRKWWLKSNTSFTSLSFNLIHQLLNTGFREDIYNQVRISIFQAIENVLSIGKKYPINTHANDPFDYECWCRPPNGSLPSSYDNVNWTALDQKTCQVNWTSHIELLLVSRNYKLLQRQLDFTTVSDSTQCYTTDESFFFQNYNGTLVGDGCNLPHYIPDVFLMSIILFMGTFLLSVELKDFKNALFFPSKV